jgi:two-component system chemotaxis sensor kinase CheA
MQLSIAGVRIQENAMSDSAIQDIFLNEAKEILTDVESDLVLLEQGGDADLLNRIFRYAHTLKGSSAIAGFDEISGFMHGLESVLDKLRSGELAINNRLTDMLLGSFDWVKLTLFGGNKESDINAAYDHCIELMNEYTTGEASMPGEEPKADVENIGYRYYRLRAIFRENIFESGIDPLSIMDDFISLGIVEEIKIDKDALPAFNELDPERCYLAWEATIKVKLPWNKIEEVFLFVKDDNEIILEDVSIRYIEEFDNDKQVENKKIGEILVRRGILTRMELDDVLATQGVKNRKIGDLVIEKGYATEREIEYGLSEQERIRTRIETETVRVDTKKLDSLLNLLGEVVIGQSAIVRIADELPDEQGLRLKNALYGLDRTTREFQEQIMSIRMIPIEGTFNQFRRFVRDAARSRGKEIKLEIFGEETELDKTVIEKIGDPLKHMIRNAVDHGIEDAAERERGGKKAEGCIRLNAYHQEGSVFIEVSDDGRGLDHEKIRAKAVTLGLLTQGEETTEDLLYSFLFLPGFTTADEAGDLSGRGVGMDVVKTNIEALRGTVTIETVPGVGTTFRVKLPLTLAIIEGMLVRSGENVYIIPLLSIVECMQPAEADIEKIEERGELVRARGEYIPLVRLYDLFGVRAECENPWEALVVIVESGRETIGIMVDELVGQQQIVIKSMSGHVSNTRAVSGAAILGDGRVALILDMHGLVSEMARR